MASLYPARYLGIDQETGSLRNGKRADMIFVDEDFICQRTFVGGKQVFDRKDDMTQKILNAEAMKLKVK